MAHVANWKKSKVETLTQMLLDYPVVGIIDIGGLPASQLQQIRRNLPTGSRFVVTKNTFLRIALNRAAEQRENIGDLMGSLDGQRGVILADVNPFKLFQNMEATKIKAPAKGGEVAPEDIEIKQGDTAFKPGPIVGELQKAGFPAAIERGKVVMKKDKLMVKEGDRIPRDVAKMLTRLEIYPITVGLTLLAGYEKGTIFLRDVLDVDVGTYIRNIETAFSHAFNLSMYICYPTEKNIRNLMQKAHLDAFNLALNAEIPTKDTASLLLAKAQMQALSLASHLPDLADQDDGPKKEDKKDEPKESKKEEPKKEKEEAQKEDKKKDKPKKDKKADEKKEDPNEDPPSE